MSIAVLAQVHEETRRLAIAGSSLAVGDFRLKKLVEPLEASAKKAPVFATVAEAIKKLVDGNENNSAQALLDLASLVIAILYTQGQTGVSGELRPLDSKQMTLATTQMSARLLKPLIEALTSKGSGRLEVIRQAYQQNAFQDLRLVNPAIAALDDVYPEIADFVTENVLPTYGKAILPEIRDRIHIKGKAGDARRLRLFHRLDPQAARKVVLAAFESGSKELKVAALSCLGDAPEDLALILEQAVAKQKDVRRVALARLGNFTDSRAVETLIAALGNTNRELVVESVRTNSSPDLWSHVIKLTSAEIKALLEIKEKAKIDKAISNLATLLECYTQRTDAEAIQQLVDAYAMRAELQKVKGSINSGKEIVSQLRRHLLHTQNPAILGRLVSDREEMLDEDFEVTFVAAVLTQSPQQVFDAYSEYLGDGTSKAKKAQAERRKLLLALLRPNDPWVYSPTRIYLANDFASKEIQASLQSASWDARWLDLAIQEDDLTLAIRLGDSRSPRLKQYLQQHLAALQKKKDLTYELVQIIRAFIDFEYKEATQLLLDTIEKYAGEKSRHYYQVYWLIPLISKLPKLALKDVEGLIPKLPERTADEIIPHLRTLQAK